MTTIQETKDAMLSGRPFCLTPGWLSLLTEAVLDAADPVFYNVDFVKTVSKIAADVTVEPNVRCKGGHVMGRLARCGSPSDLIAYYV